MKKGWEVKPLGEVAEIVNGGTPKSKISEYWSGGVQWLTPKDMGAMNEREIAETPRTISEKGLNGSSAKLIPANSVILSTRAPIGHLAINSVPMAFNQGCRGLVPGQKLDHLYLYYFLSANREQLNDLGVGTTFKELSATHLKAIKIPVPLLEEQKRIVAVLDEAFEGLARARANAEANLQNARELFESYLREVFCHKGNDWTTLPLNEKVRFIDYRGKTPPKRDFGIRLITAKNVKMGYINREPEEFIDSGAYAGWMTRGFPKNGDVLFTTEAPLANVAQLDTDETVVIGQRLITMQPDESILVPSFLKYALMSKPVQDEIHSRGTGATVLGIKAKLLKTVPISFPIDINQQLAIAAQIDNVWEYSKQLVSASVTKIVDVDGLKQSLLQKAFAGELT